MTLSVLLTMNVLVNWVTFM